MIQRPIQLLPESDQRNRTINELIRTVESLMRQLNERRRADAGPPRLVERWVGVIRAKGPQGEEDLKGAMYWVEKVGQFSPAGKPELPEVVIEPLPGSERYVAAWNIGEVALDDKDRPSGEGSHALSPGTLVHVWVEQRDTVPPSRVYYFSAGAETIIAKITGNVSGQVGRYTAKRITPETDTEATGNLSEADLGTLSDTDDLIVWHLPEIAIGASANLLDVDGIYEGTRAGVTSDGKTIVRIGAMPVGKTDSPTTLGGNTEGSESADTTSWERTSGNPVDVWIQTRQGFFHAGDEKWYAYARKFSYDSCGLLIAVSGETRIEIDAPEDC